LEAEGDQCWGCCINTKGTKDRDAWVEIVARNQQKLGPHWCQGQVQNQQDEETDKQGREQGPDEVSVAIEKQRSGLNAVLLECRQHNGCGRGRWKAHGQQCAHRGTGGSVTCSFWASDTTDSTLVAELGILTALIQ